MQRNICQDFLSNPRINPRTKRSITIGGPVYNSLIKECNSYSGNTSVYSPTVSVPIASPKPFIPTSSMIYKPFIPNPITSVIPGQFIPTQIVPTSFILAQIASPSMIPRPFIPTQIVPTSFIPTQIVPTSMIPAPSMIPRPYVLTHIASPYMVPNTFSPVIIPISTNISTPIVPSGSLSPVMQPIESNLDINNGLLLISDIQGGWGVAQRQQRASEDEYQAKRIGPYRYFGVFDGHGGSREMGPQHVGDYLKNHLHEKLAEYLGNVNLNNQQAVSNQITQVFIDIDREMFDMGCRFGSTCSLVLIDDTRNIIYQVNLGDSRSIIYQIYQGNSRSIIFNGDGIVSKTIDHDPNDYIERTRIEAAGGYVAYGRINARLMVARSFGDFQFKRINNVYDGINGMVSIIPDIKITSFKPSTVTNRNFSDTYIILTSDAPYENDAYTDETLVESFSDILSAVTIQRDYLTDVASHMVDEIVPRTTDDTTIVLVGVN